MKPRIKVITIGVDDLEVSLRFYREGLGFQAEGIVGNEFEYGAVVFFQLQPGLRLALWPRTSIAHDTGLWSSPWSSPGSADSLTMPRARSRRSSIRTRSGSCRRAVSAVVSGCRSSRCSLRSMRWRPLASGSARARPAPPSASRRSSRPRRCPSSRRRGSCSG
ncbi:uncharacterized protein SOCE836_002690 [Sorangium cellulosum]|uniref:Glyoxalase/fosfomycin resistance/dioxygenase domain-containing protein n=1 Tax=Sorangium cellulosum TaxID=56 RepID=A0A4P2QFF1_SORCE|nr:uncharacterized protein SOCE836_002690 [Sorangium cellulosum]